MGATTAESYQLSIVKEGQELGNGTGNIFITYGNFDVEWLDNNELKVTMSSGGDIFKQKTKYDDITISY